MNLDVLTAISPIDGRYRSKTETLAGYFSEYALIRYRVRVEIEYFITLCELPLPQLADFDRTLFGRLRSIYRDFTVADAQRVRLPIMMSRLLSISSRRDSMNSQKMQHVLRLTNTRNSFISV